MNGANIRIGRADEEPKTTDEFRYGIFIRPPVEVAARALELMSVARDLFGFRAATAYPPHITIIGSIVLNGTEAELIAAVDAALEGQRAITVHGARLDAQIGSAVGFDFQRLPSGERNEALADLYERVRKATAQHRGYRATDRHAEKRRLSEGREHYHAHLTVLGHDGAENLKVQDEARAVLEQLVGNVPAKWAADTVTLYRFWSADWGGRYWLTQEWVPLRSWKLPV